MPQNERLRALLAEARECLQDAQAVWRERYEDAYADSAESITDRIYTALAEPVEAEYVFRGGYIEDTSGDRWWSAGLLSKVERERDEARQSVADLTRKFEAHKAAWWDRFKYAQEGRNEAWDEIERLRAEVERLRKVMDERWAECHDGSEQSCSKSHED